MELFEKNRDMKFEDMQARARLVEQTISDIMNDFIKSNGLSILASYIYETYDTPFIFTSNVFPSGKVKHPVNRGFTSSGKRLSKSKVKLEEVEFSDIIRSDKVALSCFDEDQDRLIISLFDSNEPDTYILATDYFTFEDDKGKMVSGMSMTDDGVNIGYIRTEELMALITSIEENLGNIVWVITVNSKYIDKKIVDILIEDKPRLCMYSGREKALQ